MGENIYRFARREIPGGIRRAWAVETQRLAKTGKRPWDPANRILQPLVATVVLYLGLLAAFGIEVVPFLAIQSIVAWWQLTSANYVEHYGLLRAKRDDGRYEPCRPRHSWNSDHVASNLVLFNLQRHSDHHANPHRRYQALRTYDDVPALPSGYPAMFLIAMLPPLWRRVMDARVFTWAGHDIGRVNLDPARRQSLIETYRHPW